MVEECPESLADLCLARVAHSLESLCGTRADGSWYLGSIPLLPQEIADQLLSKMTADGVLNDRAVGVFRNTEQFRLRRACVRSSSISAEAFRLALCTHRLQELDASQVTGGLTGAQVLAGLASQPECSSGLRILTLNGLRLDLGSLEEGGRVPRVCFSALRSLRTLHLANTTLGDAGLEDVCSLPLLETLDISCTRVTRLAPLLGVSATLRSLAAHALPQLRMSATQLLAVIGRLRALRHLDVSDVRFALPAPTDDGALVEREVSKAVRQLLEGSAAVLPDLVSLDLSGQRWLTEGAVKAFVEARPGLVFLGLLSTGMASCEVLSRRPSLKVSGEANEAQICEALRRYSDREYFTRESLIVLYNLTNTIDKPSPAPDMLKLVLDGMKKHSESLHVQLVAIACVFKLTTQDLAVGIPLRLLSRVIAQLLEAMRNFPNHQMLQKKSLLVLCSDYILQDVSFDRYEAAKLVMNWLSSHEDPVLQGMAVAVISILVAKLSTEQTAQLGADIFIMKQLLGIVQQKATAGVMDSTLKFALSALWNLTDETPTASRHFIQCQGLELYEEVLESYYEESSVQQKVLGLLNNVAEVEDLQKELMDADLLERVLTLLQGAQVEVGVRYFAGGILAQLSSRETAWTLDQELRTKIHEQLHTSIQTWTPPDRVIVSYRSFHPFVALLQTSQPTGVQLWAVRAILLVCRQNAAQYCGMLLDEGAVDLLQALTAHPDTHMDVTVLALLILSIVDHYQQTHGGVRPKLVPPEERYAHEFD